MDPDRVAVDVCGSCGVRCMCAEDERFADVDLERLHVLLLSADQQEEYERRSQAYQEASGVHRAVHDGRLYHVYPDLVDDGGNVLLCPTCERALMLGKVPKLSLAAGVDYGDGMRAGLPELTFMERRVIALNRSFMEIVKLVRPVLLAVWWLTPPALSRLPVCDR
jgi:hypothetical protein